MPTSAQSVETITFLKCKQPLVLTKTWQNGHIKDYDTAKHFTVKIKKVHDIQSLASVLDAALKQPQYAVIRGTPTTDQTTDVTRTLTNFTDTPKRWVMFDIDDFTPKTLPLLDPAAGVEQWITERLPTPFHTVTAYWQLSASAGHTTRDPKKLRAHVWLWLDQPVSGTQWKRWAERNNISIDKSVLSPVQLHYTAAPVIELGQDPFTERSGFTDATDQQVTTAGLKFSDLPPQDNSFLDNGDQVLRDPRLVPGIVGRFCSNVSIADALDLIPDNFAYTDNGTGQWDSRRLDFLKGSGGKGGAYIHSDQLHLINMQNHAPHNSQQKALNAFDLVRIYKYGDLDPTDPFLRLDVTTLPSHTAMTEFAEQYLEGLTEELPDTVKQALNTQAQQQADKQPSLQKNAPKGPKFPGPYPGVMADMTAAVLLSAKVKQPELTVLGVLIGMAGGCGGHYRLPSNMRLNLYGLNISASGSGKDTIRYATKQVTDAAMATVLGCPASGQGLQDAIPDGGGVLVETDEAGHLFAGMNAKNNAAYSIELSKVLLELFSAGQGVYKTRLKAKAKGEAGSRSIPHPCISFFGSTTKEKLAASLTEDNVTDGLIGRFLFAQGQNQEDTHFDWLAPGLVVPASVTAAGAKLAWAPGIDRQIKYGPNVVPTMCQWAQEYWAQTTKGDSLARAFATRSIEKLERIAGVLAVWEDPHDPVIQLPHIEWARKFIDKSNWEVHQFITNDMGDAGSAEAKAEMQDATKLAARLAKMMEDQLAELEGWVRKNELFKCTHWGKKRCLPAYETLQLHGRVEEKSVKGAGVKSTVFVKLLA